MIDEAEWRRALALLSWKGNPEPLAELLRGHEMPLEIQQEIAELLSPRCSNPLVRLNAEINRRELGKMATLAGKIVEGYEIDSAAGKRGKIDSGVMAVEVATGKSRAHLYKAHGEAVKFRSLIRTALMSLADGNPTRPKMLQELLALRPDEVVSTICGEIRRLHLRGAFED